MSKENQFGKSPVTGEPGKEVVVPTQEQVREWIRRDISASSYFLSMLLRYPDIIEGLADELYEKIMSEEHGALIDKIKSSKPEDHG